MLIRLVKTTEFYGFHNTPHLDNMLGKFAGELKNALESTDDNVLVAIDLGLKS